MGIKITEIIFITVTLAVPTLVIFGMVTVLIKEGYFDLGAYYTSSVTTEIEM